MCLVDQLMHFFTLIRPYLKSDLSRKSFYLSKHFNLLTKGLRSQ